LQSVGESGKRTGQAGYLVVRNISGIGLEKRGRVGKGVLFGVLNVRSKKITYEGSSAIRLKGRGNNYMRVL